MFTARRAYTLGLNIPPQPCAKRTRGRDGISRAFSAGSQALTIGAKYMEEWRMLWTIFLVLVVLWMLGVVSSYTLGGFIHVLLVLAVVALLVQLIQGRRVV
jgi:hypothetical protein